MDVPCGCCVMPQAMIAITAFVAQELVEKIEIFEHLFLRFAKEATVFWSWTTWSGEGKGE